MNAIPDYRTVNAAHWDERVPIHVASDFYAESGFAHRRDSLRPFELAEVGDVEGKSLVHLQCHFGQDTLSWAKHGATVSGVDFSRPAIEEASRLAKDLGIDAEFVVADAYDAGRALGNRAYDVVYTGIGALGWLPDMTRWAATVAELLKPGGFLYLAEFHPITFCLDEVTGRRVERDYFRATPIRAEFSGSYADWNHSCIRSRRPEIDGGYRDPVVHR